MKQTIRLTFVLCIFMLGNIFSMCAQQIASKGLTAIVGHDRWSSDARNCSAVWDEVSGLLTISANSEDDENITIQFKAEGSLYANGFSVGEYYFYRDSKFADNYSIKAIYSMNTNSTPAVWQNDEESERSPGKVKITEVSAKKIKGEFYFDLVKKNNYSFDKANVVSVTEGNFEIDFATSAMPRNYNSPVGIFDIQIAPGINWMKPKMGLDLDGDFGTNYSVGFTVFNLEHGEASGSSSTVSVHYDYSRQNGEAYLMGTWHFRRHELFARIKPFTNNPVYSSTYNSIWAILVSGLYADVGYTNGTYYYSNYLDERQAPDYDQNGLVWGWGCNLINRPEDKRWGMTVGYGSKIYNWTKSNGDRAKYSSRTIWVGSTYNFVWRE